MGSEMGGVSDICNADGNLYVRYLNWNGSQWNWNYNWLDNDFDADNPAALAALFFLLRYFLTGEFCFTICPFQPPSILPIPFNFSEREMYFLLSKDFVSKRSKINIFKASAFLMPRRI